MASHLVPSNAPLDLLMRIGVRDSEKGSHVPGCSLTVIIPDFDESQRISRTLTFRSIALMQGEAEFTFDVDCPLLALRSGRTVPEISMKWNDVQGSAVRTSGDRARQFASVVGLWFRSEEGAHWRFSLHPETH